MAYQNARYIVWLAPKNDNTNYKRTNRLLIQDFRRQAKGLGGANFRLLRSNPIPGGELSEDFYDSLDVITEGTRVKIVDSWFSSASTPNPLDEGPDSIVFWGFLNSISYDVFEAEDTQVGQVTAQEMGWKLQQDVIDTYLDSNGIRLQNPPPFNPYVDDSWLGNRSDNNTFRTSEFLTSSNGYQPEPTGDPPVTPPAISAWFPKTDEGGVGDLTYVWSRENIIDLILASSSISLTADYTLGIIPEPENPGDPTPPSEPIEYFSDKSRPRSFENFYLQPIMRALDSLVEEPLCWYLDYTSSLDQATVVFYSKNISGSSLIPDLSDTALDLDLTDTDTREVNLNITETDSSYDQIVLNGGPILCCGSLSPVSKIGNVPSLVRDWTDNDQQLYVKGTDLTDTDSRATDRDEGDRFRSSIKNVYRYFKFNYLDTSGKKDIITITKTPGSVQDGPTTSYAFCPKFNLFTTGSGFAIEDYPDVPTFQKDVFSVSTDHSTPNQLSISFSDFLPIHNTITANVGATENIIDDKTMLKPLCMAPLYTGGNPLAWVNIIDETISSKIISPSKLSYFRTGFRLENAIPQNYAWDTDKLWEGKGGTLSGTEWKPAQEPGATNYNPLSGDELNERGKSIWERFIFTAGIYSNQRLSITLNKSGVTTPTRIKIIEDNDLQIWFVHENTVVGYDSNGLMRIASDVYTRNDMPLAKQLASDFLAWYSKDRAAVAFDYPIMNYYTDEGKNSWIKIGTGFKKVIDRDLKEIVVNTVVSSVEYNLSGSPRLIITTELPAEPEIKRMRTEISLGAIDGVNSSTQGATAGSFISAVPKQVNVQQSIGTGISGIGTSAGSSSGSSSILGVVVGGGSSDVSSELNIITPIPEIENGFINLLPTVADWTAIDLADDWDFGDEVNACPDGIGFVQLIRPYSYSNSSWDAAFDESLPLNPQGNVPLVSSVKTAKSDLGIISIYWDRDCTIVSGSETGKLTINTDSATPLSVTSYSITDNLMSVILSRDLVSTEEVTLTIDAQTVEVTVETVVYQNTASTWDVIFTLAKSTLVLALNNRGIQKFVKGQLVRMVGTQDIIDSNGVSRTIPIIETASDGNVIHDHTSFASNGLGQAILTPAGFAI